MTKRKNLDTTPDSSDSEGDAIMYDEHPDLAIRTREPQVDEPATVHLSAPKSGNAFLVTINPPAKPAHALKHAPCDIVIVIDVSGSMANLAPLPDVEDDTEKESSGLTVLDLVKHSCRTILETLNETDRLSLVTFSYNAKVITPLLHMTEDAKKDTIDKINKLKTEGATNLWDGIKTGLQQFENNPPSGNVQGLYVLTDGQPNYMCPQQGYIPKLTPILEKLASDNGSAPSIQTFGFGYSIRSDLMLSIAKAGNGNYAFIPEVSMIGTVFVHAVANLYSTYATNAVLNLIVSASNITIEHRSGLPITRRTSGRYSIHLGNLLYGQSRDLIIHTSSPLDSTATPIGVHLNYIQRTRSNETIIVNAVLGKLPTPAPPMFDYHLARDRLCTFLSGVYPYDNTRTQHITAPSASIISQKQHFESLVKHLITIPNSTTDPDISSILSDLLGPQLDPKTPAQGQIWQALDTKPQTKDSRVFKSYWQRWGCHYLSSLWCAHMRQTCNSFKDAGPLRYGINSEIFKQCRDELDSAFDNLPPPEGTWTGAIQPVGNTMPIPAYAALRRSNPNSTLSPMSRYNRNSEVCFLGSCTVQMVDGQTLKVSELRSGMTIENPLTKTSRQITAIVKSGSSTTEIVRVGSLWITPWHPIFVDGEWIFPHQIAEETRTLEDHEAVYSILLSPSDCVDDHAVQVEGLTCVTLGHGLTDVESEDFRVHDFFGRYELVKTNIIRLDVDEDGRYLCAGLLRSRSGSVCKLLDSTMKVESGIILTARKSGRLYWIG